MSKITTALIGCGGRGPQGHAKVAQASGSLELVAVCDIDQRRAKSVGEKFGVEYVIDYHQLLTRNDIESVIIATGTKQHGPIAIDAARTKKHILIEKPLVDSVSTGKDLIKVVEESGVIGMVGYQQRFTAFTQRLKQEASEVEPLQALMTVQRGLLRSPYFVPEHYGGIIDTATHTIHQALWIMDDIPSGVYSTLRRGTFSRDQTIGYANLMIDYDNGARTSTIITSMGSVQVPNVIQIIGRYGTISSSDRKTLQVAKHRGFDLNDRQPIGLETQTIDLDETSHNPIAEMHSHFAHLISGEEKEQRGTTLREGLLAVMVTEAMALSAERGQRVSLTEVMDQ
ncbi:TPA: Gfo/Idh/MocA family oxidoreductase [Candidatus Poribacteria bacterium]|nr:Gfo/Idh/MocA family oxidoreductase [Candidatus Poribacteria bacterium]HIA65642.1 Gfo/Idh/MocA family oxidoreductase [Candidatus Poribacteria bacterium]HIB88554.1 Gfo/Idh/MocA family oxidoreductase [Candidatus Poribacteria bacterium]HIC03774.1 Gfo/Idh/MocA family oxidoreductase [Candidatus Poribacteria bacterium]HIM10492.1 Gfo/Idh/MocA family oxidoreductase [Candidatus Poribacteria bacterium]